MSITYRTPTTKDWSTIDHLFRVSFCDTFAHLYAEEDLDAFLADFTEQAWTAQLTDAAYAFLLAEDEGEPVGYVKLGPRELPVASAENSIELRQLYLLKHWHGQGIAEHLMRWAVDTAKERGAAEMFLTVYTDNHRARRFYERWGFDYVGPYTFMVGNHRDEDIIMRRPL
ncbi:GNAT family N-acetyltransferase [Sphingomonas piscis]|uniref:GNAT family N-acetyltransferase n=1 Tax=Sphingomonas piscis TaxID=2714943 RepID=A0A6G7YQJ2_9SPHN|nr:GNAT family N-acetyltransferase [Sphingomonas piscis]QIK79015.1 GNAT family N-acetyltransferase [Sphingomonas piscis]